MPDTPTHYANLRVARNAPPEVIRAAYKALMQKHHPDRHPGDPEADRIVRLLNDAYAVLNDPEQRARHDAWIAAQKETRLRTQLQQLNAGAKSSAHASPSPKRWWIALAILLAFGLGMGLATQMTTRAYPTATSAWRR